MPRRWLGLIPVPRLVATQLERAANDLEPFIVGHRWFISAFIAGVIPLLIALAVGSAVHQIASGMLGFLLLLPALRRDDSFRAVGIVALLFVSHSVVAIAASRYWPTATAAAFPGGAEYFDKNLYWIRTGIDPEYIAGNWVPAHFQLLGAMLFFTIMSLGLAPLWQGFHEVDLMNHYVGRLLATSDGSPMSFLFGWHPWSVCRGICYTLLVVEMGSLSLEGLLGKPLSTRRRRLTRWSIAAAFFCFDCLLKYFALDFVRNQLAAHLLSAP